MIWNGSPTTDDRYREGFRMPAQREIDLDFMTHAESKMNISGCFAKEVLTRLRKIKPVTES